jgi:hypothetical protein
MINGRKWSRGARPWDLLNSDIGRVEEEVQAERLSICEACPLLHPLTKNCAECGCLMHFKTKLPNAFCPLGKWDTAPKKEDKTN